jgi:excinuclease ABC subunit A
MSVNEALVYYGRPGVMTEVGEHGNWLEGLPTGVAELCGVVQGLLIHVMGTRLYDAQLSSLQRKEVTIRPVRQMLEKLRGVDERPLTVVRPPEQRLASTCRDFALLFVGLARQQGIPARVRVGFANYFGGSERYGNHWVAEYWHRGEERWVMIDPQIDDSLYDRLRMKLNVLDIEPDYYYTAARAWQAVRAGEVSSARFGFGKVRGLPHIRNCLLLDMAAMNKLEVLPWDHWWELGVKKEELVGGEERAYLDGLAALVEGGNEALPRLRAAYEDDPRLFTPAQAKLRELRLVEGGPEPGALQLRPGPHSRLLARANGLAAGRNGHGRPALFADRPVVSVDPASIVVRGAAQHNLKHIDVSIPRYQFVVLTGVSGSGKSSLAFDTLYAEGQRRYVESLSPYIRRYLEQMEKPKVDFIGGLSPAIAIEQKTVSKNPRSTVGTITEVSDYLRVLFSRLGTRHCPQCGQAVEPLTPQQIADTLAALPAGTSFWLLAPLSHNRKSNVGKLLAKAVRDGFTEARVDGRMVNLKESLAEMRQLDTGQEERHNVALLVDALVAPAEVDEEMARRLIESVERGLLAGHGRLVVRLGDGEEMVLSQENICPSCQIHLPALTAALFSPNGPQGMCPVCNGLGIQLQIDPDLIVQDPTISILDGAVRWYGSMKKKKSSYWLGSVQAIAEHYGADLERPWQELPEKFRQVLLYGSGEEKIHFKRETEWDSGNWSGESWQTVKGIVHSINRLFRQTKSEGSKRWYVSFMSKQPCPTCEGDRLCAPARTVTIGGRSFPQVMKMTVQEALGWVVALAGGELGGTQEKSQIPNPKSQEEGSRGKAGELKKGGELSIVNGQLSIANEEGTKLSGEKLAVAEEVLKELHDRLQFMSSVGLHYLTLDRPAPTLSGGEGQRIRLASQLGCGLVGVLYILDEPSIGLHSRDQHNLLETLLQLRDMGNTVLVVEHDSETMRAADWLIDMGPGAGVLGGEVVAAGTPAAVMADPASLTGRYLSGEMVVRAGADDGQRRAATGWLTIQGARLFNLKRVKARFPLGVFTAVTGVSGSGKSSLVAETLYPALRRALHNDAATPGAHDRIEGLAQLDKVINITQDAIGRTPRSNPATYVGVFDGIREVFVETAEAQKRGYTAGRFSFNAKGGRCEVCQGYGQKKIEMHFLPDVWVTCQECKGHRFNRHTLEIRYRGKNIAEVLEMDVQEALTFFSGHAKIERILQTLHDVGLDYVKLGQSATTLSGGEAQRVKLARELCRLATGRTVYILDEPTTGLHFADIQRLLDVLHRLVDAGNTVIVIEHNLDVVKTADWIIDLGPEGGAAGGYIVAEGTPEEVAEVEGSYTGRFLRGVLGGRELGATRGNSGELKKEWVSRTEGITGFGEGVLT